MQQIVMIFMWLFISFSSFAQIQDTTIADTSNAYYRIQKEIKSYRVDTTDPPNDRFTRKILELRKMEGVVNLSRVISFILNEKLSKKEISQEKFNAINAFASEGPGVRLLNNANVWLYRNTFSYNEIKKLIRFYKSDTGKKLSSHHPILIIESLMNIQSVMENIH